MSDSAARTLPPIPGPMTFGQILDRIFRLVRAQWKLLTRIALLPMALNVVMIGLAGVLFLSMFLPVIEKKIDSIEPMTIATLSGAGAIFEIGIFFVFALYLPATTYAELAINRGASVTAGESYRFARERYGRFLWLLFLLALILFLPVLFMAVCFGVFALATNGFSAANLNPAIFVFFPLLFVFYLGYLAYVVLIGLRYCFAFAICVDEQVPVREALRRSAQLTRGARGRIFLVLLVVYAILYAAMYVFMMLIIALAAIVVFAAAAIKIQPGSPEFIALVSLGALAYVAMIVSMQAANYIGMTSAIAVLYDDQKLRLALQQPPAVPAPPGARA